jgi:type IV pilus modification protein PilV
MKSKGFTLIEVLIALVILSVAFLGLAGLMVQTTKNNSFGGRMTEAATFAQDKLEELRAVSWVTITSGSDRKTGSAIGTDYARNWDVATNGNLKTITITINWNDKANHSISLLSVITQ